MTREESKEHIRRYSNGLWGMVRMEHIDKVLDQIYNDHEAQLQALQHRSCEGCENEAEMVKLSEYTCVPNSCVDCSRVVHKTDKFKPKEQ